MRNLKRIIALAATFALTLTSTAFASNYSDVADDSAYAEAIETLSKLNIFTGDDQDGDGVMSFRPEDKVTRAEFAALIARIQGFEGTAMSQTTTIFNDVPATHWASGYIAQATNQGIVNGYGDGNFGPEDEVKYEEAIKMIMATLGYEPYAKQEGGYPTGYLTAATRYNVTKGVTNTTTGVAATRGTIAQLLNNAIDTALMGQAKWSNSGIVEYVIYDGVTQAYKTLMSEYLGVTKLKGKVTANSITELETSKTIDTTKEPEITVDVTNNFNTTNDDFLGDENNYVGLKTFDVAGTDAEDYLGQAVVLYVKEDTIDDTYDVVSIAPETGKNTKVEFSLDKFEDAGEDTTGNTTKKYLKYMKNDTDRSATKITLEDDVKVIYNNVANPDEFSFDALFMNGGVIQKDTKLGGKVVAYDTDNVTGYDVVFVEVAATGVVDDVVNGKISFKEPIGSSTTANSVSSIVVDEDDDDVIVNITKDGKKISVDELKEWDVLTVITNDASEVYNVEVLSGNNVIEGSISATSKSTTSFTDEAYRINGVKYDVAENAYKCGNLKVGNSGLFYVDAYGKIVAFNKDASSTGKANYNYAYILGINDVDDGFGTKLQVKLLTAKQGVVVWDVADKLKIQSPGEVEKTYDTTEKATLDDAMAILKSVDTISYTLSGSKVKTITLPGYEDDGFQADKKDLSSAKYDAEDLRLGSKDVNEDTVVLFVSADEDRCEVGTIADLVDEESYAGVLAYNDSDDEDALNLVVIDVDVNRNIYGGSSSAAVICDVYEAQNENEEDIYTIEFLMDGEVKTANTTTEAYADIKNITEGDVYKFRFNAAGEIKEAMAYVDFDETVRYKGEIPTDYTISDELGQKEKVYVAPVDVYKTTTKSLTLANGTSLKLSKAKNVYVIDSSKKNGKVSLGSLGDIEYNKDLTEPKTPIVSVKDKEGNPLAGSDVSGLLDWVVVREYDEDVVDVVVIKAYDFGRLDITNE